MTIGVKYVAYANSSGYGLLALAYVRALHNVGVPVWWQPSFLGGPVDRIWRPEQGMAALPLAHADTGDARCPICRCWRGNSAARSPTTR
jgi:hypothetical protein